jgi:O-antigen/teichoic acid export membrane protein
LRIPSKLIAVLPGPAQRLAESLFMGSGERARSGRSALTAFLIRVVSAAIAFLSQVFLARWIGTFEFGLFTTAWVWITVIGSLATLGFATSVIRFLPEYRETQSEDLARGFLRMGRTVSVLSGATAMVLGWGAIAWGLVDSRLALPLALALAALPAYALTDFQDGLGRAQGWLDLALLPPYVLRPVFLLSFIAIVVLEGHAQTAATAALAATAATWGAAAIQYFLMKRKMAGNLPSGPRTYRLSLWIKLSLSMLLLDGFSLLMLNLDILMLQAYVTPDQVGIYFAAIRTISLVSFVHFAISAVAMTKFSELRAAGRHDEICPTLRDMQKWTFWPSFLGIAALLGLGYPLLWLFGPDFTKAYPVMFILAAGLLVRSLAGPAQSLLVVAGHQRTAAIILMLTVMLNLGLNLVLIPLWGIMGAAAATAASFAFEAIGTIAACNKHFPSTSEAFSGTTKS